MLQASYSGRFKKDVKLLQKRGKNMDKLKTAITLLLNESELPPKYLDHSLKGDWKGWRDLHLEPDWLLIYKPLNNEIRFERTGTHADLFG